MPEPIAIASAVSTIVVSGIKLCLSVYGTIDGMKQAPKHLKAVSADLKAFYGILGTIQAYLDDEELTHGLLHSQTCDSLREILANCVSVLQEFEKIVSGYIKAGRISSTTAWQKVAWSCKASDVESLRRHLSDHKASLNIAIAMANHIKNEMIIYASISRVETSFEEFLKRSEAEFATTRADIAALLANLPHSEESSNDRNTVLQSQRATIKTFAQDAESVLTASLMEPTRTMTKQASVLIPTSTRTTSFTTAKTHITTQATTFRTTSYPRQLLVRGLGNRTVVLQDSAEFRHGHQLMVAVEARTSVPILHFWLTYGGKVIDEGTNMDIVPQDATIHAHIRPGIKDTKDRIIVTTWYGKQLEFLKYWESQKVAVFDLKEAIWANLGIPISHQILRFDGAQRDDNNYVPSYADIRLTWDPPMFKWR